MVKKAFHTVFSVAMAFMVLLSTASFTVQNHFCGDILIDSSIFSQAKSCGMNMSSSEKKQCCKDEIVIVKGQDKLKHSKFEELSFHHQDLVSSFVYSYLNLFESVDKEIVPHKDYSPPNLVADIQVLDQVFII